jgi:alkanesulfonate monooxygenase SsuD/methylene tetrahydromethanopterin reductase-like flavin-dependent oxidoreductase (luciferase family)
VTTPVDTVEVGVRVPHAALRGGSSRLRAFVEAAEDAGIDRLWVGDHVSFKGGQGYDGLLQAMALAVVSDRITVQTAVYLLPLRHPLVVARQVASIVDLAPRRFVFGVGVGGDDPDEPRNCGIDPGSRGRRTDEALPLVRRLLAGDEVSFRGEYFDLEAASIRPTPAQRVPVVVGGRSPAALRRAGQHGDGWLGVFVSPSRFAESIAGVGEAAAVAGRTSVDQHGLLVWCGFGRSPAAEMEALYQLPFERFQRYAPHGSPEDVAAALVPYVGAGARSVLLAAVAHDDDGVVEGAAAVRATLRRATPGDR